MEKKVIVAGIKYDIDMEHQTAKVIYRRYSGEIKIPSTIKYNREFYRVTAINHCAFEECRDLTAITIPSSVVAIGENAFLSCWGLTSMVVEEGNPTYDSREGCHAIIETMTNTLLFGCSNTSIPTSVTSIGDMAFFGFVDLKSITLPANLTTIGEYAFARCCSLKSLIIPAGVTSIGDFAFWACKELTSIVVEKGNTTYDSREDCHAIIETSSNTLVFGCRNTIIPRSVTAIGRFAFSECSDLKAIIIPDNVSFIGFGAFERCSSLTSVTIPGSVDVIYYSAFWICDNLTVIVLGHGIRKICGDAFRHTKKLTDVYCNSKDVPETDANAFTKSRTINATLHVPTEAVEKYRNAVPWKWFRDIVPLT